MRLTARVVSVVVGLACLGDTARAEVLGPLLPSRTLEVGIMQRKTNRLMERSYGDAYQLETYDYPVTLRYGVTSSATISFELAGYPNSWIYEDGVIIYTVGAGIAALVWSDDGLAVSTSAHYYRKLTVSQSLGDCDNVVQGIDWALLAERSFRLGPGRSVIWGGPTVSYLIREAQAPCDDVTATPEQVFGGVVGLTLVSRIGLSLQGSYVWLGDSEYRLSLAYRFGPRS